MAADDQQSRSIYVGNLDSRSVYALLGACSFDPAL